MLIQCDGCHAYIETVGPAPHMCPGETPAFAAGRKARAARIPLRQSALRMINPASQRYDDFIDGYDFEAEQRKRKPKKQSPETGTK